VRGCGQERGREGKGRDLWVVMGGLGGGAVGENAVLEGSRILAPHPRQPRRPPAPAEEGEE
jgi:hypothetical protein